jgi:hypothetical protein
VKNVQKHVWASATLVLLIAACGGSQTPTAGSSSAGTTSCVNATSAHRVYIVVEHLSGRTVQRCVGFAGDAVDAVTLMKRSKIEYQAQATSFGLGVCQIDNEPARFSECFPQGQPYWSLWIESGGSWTMSQVGFSEVRLHDRDVLGWRYVAQTGPSPSPPPKPRT